MDEGAGQDSNNILFRKRAGGSERQGNQVSERRAAEPDAKMLDSFVTPSAQLRDCCIPAIGWLVNLPPASVGPLGRIPRRYESRVEGWPAVNVGSRGISKGEATFAWNP